MVKFSLIALNFGYDFVLLVHPVESLFEHYNISIPEKAKPSLGYNLKSDCKQLRGRSRKLPKSLNFELVMASSAALPGTH